MSCEGLAGVCRQTCSRIPSISGALGEDVTMQKKLLCEEKVFFLTGNLLLAEIKFVVKKTQPTRCQICFQSS